MDLVVVVVVCCQSVLVDSPFLVRRCCCCCLRLQKIRLITWGEVTSLLDLRSVRTINNIPICSAALSGDLSLAMVDYVRPTRHNKEYPIPVDAVVVVVAVVNFCTTRCKELSANAFGRTTIKCKHKQTKRTMALREPKMTAEQTCATRPEICRFGSCLRYHSIVKQQNNDYATSHRLTRKNQQTSNIQKWFMLRWILRPLISHKTSRSYLCNALMPKFVNNKTGQDWCRERNTKHVFKLLYFHTPLVKTEVEGARTKFNGKAGQWDAVQLNLKPNYGWHNLHFN